MDSSDVYEIAFSPMVVKFAGRVTEVKDEHLDSISFGNSFRSGGDTKPVMAEQLIKACEPMVVTLSGMATDVM